MTDKEVLRAKLNLETSQIAWRELQRFFAQGKVLAVKGGIDLVDVALSMTLDDKSQFEDWLFEGEVEKVSDEVALSWHDEDAKLWAIVVSPWILVQRPQPLTLH